MTNLTLSPTLARRLAITRQRLAGPPPPATPAGILDVLKDIRCLQLDPIRAVERTQYLVLWSRLGHYNPDHLHTLLWDTRQLFEYWAHAASIVLTEDYPIHHWYMRHFHNGGGWPRARAWLAENRSFERYILERLHQAGPLGSAQLEDRAETMWESGGWTAGRHVGRMLDILWERGDIVVAGRQGIQRQWALAKDFLPEWTPREELSDREVVRRATQAALRALGVGTARHINAHFTRDRYPNLNEVLAELVTEGQIIPVQIDGWSGDWLLHAADLRLLEQLGDDGWQPRTTLLSPFDNLICDRDRTELMWDFYFRIEIYVPAAKRQYGYYVLPILHGDRLIGRIDPKMERKTGTLHVNAVYAETDAPAEAGPAVAAAVANLAQFLDAKRIELTEKIPPMWRDSFTQVG